jgi:hypothetical protein
MRSGVSTRRPAPSGLATSSEYTDETYDLRGVNLVTPDQVMPAGDSPYNINTRMYARNVGQSRVAVRTRKGTAFLSTPIGEALNVQNVAASTGVLDFTVVRALAQPFTPSADGALTKVSLEMYKTAGSTGHVRVNICTDNAGIPGTIIAESSISATNLTTSLAYSDALFIDAPYLSNGTQYWLVVYIQDNGTGTYHLNQTADSGALDLQSLDEQASWSALGSSFRFKSYLSTEGGIKGFTRRYPSNNVNRTIIAHLGKIYSVTNAGVSTQIDTGLSTSADKVRFENIDDKTIWVNGVDNPRWWDGSAASSDITSAPAAASHVIAHQNRLFFVTDKVRVSFSDLYNFTSYPSVNFFYVPNPKSSDHITGWRVFQNDLVIFTHETKHRVVGSDISTFDRKEAVGTKGAVSDEAIAVDRNYIYFMADDGMIYRYNGSSDELISDKIEPELADIQDKTQVRLQIYRNQLRVYYASASSPINDRMALCDLIYSKPADFQWFIDTGRPLSGAMELTQDNNELLEFSARVGQFFTAEQMYSDMGKPIDWKYWTPYKSYGYHTRRGSGTGGGSAKKRVKSFRPILRTVDSSYTMQIGKDIDFNNTPDMRPYEVNGGGAKWGAFVWGDGTKWGRTALIDARAGMSGRGKHVQYRFERKGVETPVDMYGYIARVKVGRPK